MINSKSASVQGELRRIHAFLGNRKTKLALGACSHLSKSNPKSSEVWLWYARAAHQANQFCAMRSHAKLACDLGPNSVEAKLVLIESHIYMGNIEKVRDMLMSVERLPNIRPKNWERVGVLYTQLGFHQRAKHASEKCVESGGDDLNGLRLMAGANIALGNMEDAETALDDIIVRDGMDTGAWYSRSTLKRQTQANNHIDALKEKLAIFPQNHPARTALYYALGKECEDLGKHDEVFSHYSDGAKHRHKSLSYDVNSDREIMAEIKNTFNADWYSQISSGYSDAKPIFVFGLPRSGTTLVERILASHSCADTLGETNDFVYALMGETENIKKGDNFVQRTSYVDMHKLGRRYWGALTGYDNTFKNASQNLIDKTPSNYLYLGLLAKAMPQAKFVHVSRQPMASGYSMYKALFEMGYPFSYDLESIGQYMGAYSRLMEHWRNLFGNRILDVQYEDLVSDPESMTREMLAFCELEFEQPCLDFHMNKASSATASAAQIREPIHSRFVDAYKNYEQQLSPLKRQLQKEELI